MSNKPQKPELLAPAGNIESFYAAIEAGADAVYLGTADFNARLRAKNFTVRTLGALIPYAHSRSVKVYVTINTIIKQREIEDVLNLLYQLEQLGAGAVIAADIGVMKLAALHFPNLKIHGSTQAAVHNSYGAAFLKTLGAKRAVLARELSIDEIRETNRKSPIELEVFIHGALCYSISGMCLASSFIGGSSGNRGCCAQVCRRKFKTGRKEGYFFSPFDLQAVYSVAKLAKAGISSLKIEGRMKGPEYVSTVTAAYRHVIDFPGEASTAAQKLLFDFGRPKTSFFLDGCKGNYIDPFYPAGTGIFLGNVINHGETSFTLSNKAALTLDSGDRLRIQPQSGFEGSICKIEECGKQEDTVVIKTKSTVKCGSGDHVFLIGKAVQNKRFTESAQTAAAKSSVNLRTIYPNAHKIIKCLSSPKPVISADNHNQKIWFRADSVAWLTILNINACKNLIFDADIKEIEQLLSNPEVLKRWRPKLFIAPPPFIEESKLDVWHSIIKKCRGAGLQSFAVSNAGHFELVKEAKHLSAQTPLWSLNRLTQKELQKRYVEWFEYSSEDDFINLRAASSIKGIVTLYGKPQLFISRMPPPVAGGSILSDSHKNGFFVKVKNNLCYTIASTPVCLFAKREKISSCGIENFLIDLCFHDPDQKLADSLVSNFRAGVKVEGSTMFNFKLGLR
ncbi:MAG: U32 family peptidase [Chitinispirillales bacterium]|jgi:putative protease|nr:U32 family peptidase [Chitinispirillales bacterium]